MANRIYMDGVIRSDSHPLLKTEIVTTCPLYDSVYDGRGTYSNTSSQM